MDDVCRYLYFCSLQEDDGVSTQLHALGLKVLSAAEAQGNPVADNIWRDASTGSSKLQAQANSTPQAKEARYCLNFAPTNNMHMWFSIPRVICVSPIETTVTFLQVGSQSSCGC